MKYRWKVQSAPTGRFSSFARRGWPRAEYLNEEQNIAAAIYCTDPYRPSDARTGNHSELILRVADYRETPWQWRTLKRRFDTLEEVKAYFKKFIADNPQLCPKETISERK